MINTLNERMRRISGEFTLTWDMKKNTLTVTRAGEKIFWDDRSLQKNTCRAISAESFQWWVEVMAELLCRKIISSRCLQNNSFVVTFSDPNSP
jgi:hypothetical protein